MIVETHWARFLSSEKRSTTREMEVKMKTFHLTSGLWPQCAQQRTSPHTDTFIFYEGRSGSVGLAMRMDEFLSIHSLQQERNFQDSKLSFFNYPKVWSCCWIDQ